MMRRPGLTCPASRHPCPGTAWQNARGTRTAAPVTQSARLAKLAIRASAAAARFLKRISTRCVSCGTVLHAQKGLHGMFQRKHLGHWLVPPLHPVRCSDAHHTIHVISAYCIAPAAPNALVLRLTRWGIGPWMSGSTRCACACASGQRNHSTDTSQLTLPRTAPMVALVSFGVRVGEERANQDVGGVATMTEWSKDAAGADLVQAAAAEPPGPTIRVSLKIGPFAAWYATALSSVDIKCRLHAHAQLGQQERGSSSRCTSSP